jgi:UPF0755 protein
MKIVKWLSIIVVTLGIILVAILIHFEKEVHQSLNLTEATVYQVKPGQSAKGLLNSY